MKKRLLIVTDTFLPRREGITRFLLNLLPKLKEQYDVTILAPDFGTEKSAAGIIRLPCYKFQVGDLNPPKFNFWRVRHYVKNSDIVFVQSIGPLGASAIFNAVLSGKKVIAYIHVIEWEVVTKAIKRKFLKGVLNRAIRLAAKYLYNSCSLIMLPSSDIAELLTNNRIKTKKVIVHLGVDVNKFTPSKDRAASKSKIGISPEKKVITYVGRLAREKDLITLYRAFLRLKKKHPKAVLLVVGDGLEEIKERLRKKSIILTGAVDDVVPYLQATDIYVLPSLTETSSLSTMEAMSCGLAVVVTPVGYVKDYVIDSYNGLFFSKGDSYALFKRLEKLAENDKITRRMGINARKTMLEDYPWDKTARKIASILKEI